MAAILRVMGSGNDPHFTNYNRVLSKARWLDLQTAKILQGLLVALVPVNWPIITAFPDGINALLLQLGVPNLRCNHRFYRLLLNLLL